MTNTYDYEPFGAILSSGGEARKGFNSREKDSEHDLFNNGVRKLDDGVGKFTSIDPLWEKFRSWSPYQYGYNNPLGVTDPDGLQGRPARRPQRTRAQKAQAARRRAELEASRKLVPSMTPRTRKATESENQTAAARREGSTRANMERNSTGVKLTPPTQSSIVRNAGTPYKNSNQARRAAMREAGIPTSSTPTSQKSTSNGAQYLYEVHRTTGKVTVVVTHHKPDLRHPNGHWEVGNARFNTDGNVEVGNHGQWRYHNRVTSTLGTSRSKVKVEYLHSAD